MDDLPLIFTYTRAQALADGVLIDVTPTACAAGFRCSVAVTKALWDDITDIPPRLAGIADVDGRLWDVLWMAFLHARRNPHASRSTYELSLPVGAARTRRYTVQMVAGPGDAGELVITLLRPEES